MARLTDKTLAQSSAITPTTLIHIVYTGDTSQNPAGSSYKVELQQLGSIFSGGSSINPFNNSGSGSTITWNVSGVSTNYEATLTASTTLNLTNVRNGEYGTLIINQPSVGFYGITLGTVNGAAANHRVVNGAGGIILTSTSNAIDIISFTYNGTKMFWTVGNDYV